MSKTTLTYFNVSTSRGEECRLALFLAGVPFEDERLTMDQWAQRSASTPYGALPVLTVEGRGALAQSNAILRWVGSEHGLHPKDSWEAARHESVMGAVEDLRARLGPINRMKDPEEKKRAREELAQGYLQTWAASIEKQLQGPFVGGASISVADLKLFVVMSPFLAGTIDHVPKDVFKAHPKLLRAFEAVQAHPKITEWQARGSGR